MDFQPAFRTLILVGSMIIIISLAGLGKYWIVRFRRSKLFTAKNVTEVSCPPVAYQRNILENFSTSLRDMEDWICFM